MYWVTAGVIVGHSMCTGLAVIGGRMLAAKISVRTGKLNQSHFKIGIILILHLLVTFAGAILFLVFGVYYSYHAYQGQLE